MHSFIPPWQIPHCSRQHLQPYLAESQRSQPVCFLMIQESGQKAHTFHWLLCLMNCYIPGDSVCIHTALVLWPCFQSLVCSDLWIEAGAGWKLELLLHESIYNSIQNNKFEKFKLFCHSVFHPNHLWPQTELQSTSRGPKQPVSRILFLSREVKAVSVPPSS